MFIDTYMKEKSFESESKLMHYVLEGLSYRINDMINENMLTRDAALTDDISKLPNARSANMYFNELNEKKEHCSIFFIDGDNLRNFNLVNYKYGNEAIERIGSVIQCTIRKTDKVYRWLSGDEFIVVAEGIETNKVTDLAERIRRNVELEFSQEESGLNATISIGISRYPIDSDNIHNIISFAELANKEAKKMGKNRFVFYAQ